MKNLIVTDRHTIAKAFKLWEARHLTDPDAFIDMSVNEGTEYFIKTLAQVCTPVEKEAIYYLADETHE